MAVTVHIATSHAQVLICFLWVRLTYLQDFDISACQDVGLSSLTEVCYDHANPNASSFTTSPGTSAKKLSELHNVQLRSPAPPNDPRRQTATPPAQKFDNEPPLSTLQPRNSARRPDSHAHRNSTISSAPLSLPTRQLRRYLDMGSVKCLLHRN